MMWKDKIAFVILSLLWAFLYDFTSNLDFDKCSWFYRKFWKIFQILLKFKIWMKILLHLKYYYIVQKQFKDENLK
jgi:hypothetical protein